MPDSTEMERALLVNDIHIQATYRLTEALVSSEKKMRRRIELLTEIVFEMDALGALTFLNEAWRKVLRHELLTSIGRPLRSFVVEDDRAQLDRSLALPVSSTAGMRPQLRFLRQDGEIVWMELSVTPLDEGGVVGTLHDVTQAKLAQAELVKLSLVASYTDSLVAITDKRGLIEWVNTAFTRKTGYSLAEVIGKKPGSVLQGPATDPAAARLIGERLRKGQGFQCEILNYSKTNEKYWVSIHISPIHDAEGKVERFVAIQTDLTELRKIQQDLKTAKEAAESASDAKTQFLATISHEMRTPLNVILGSADLALDGASETELRHYMTRVDENAQTLLGLISDLLDVSKIEAGQFEWERVPFPLRDRLRLALETVAERAASKGLSFTATIDDQLPERVLADPVRLGQIITNLAENAVKFTDTGFIRVEAYSASRSSSPPVLAIRVSDSGAGIPSAALPRIFDRFFQGDSSTTRRKGGAGLGLSIVKSLVDAMGGTITVNSVSGQGAEFEVLLPLEPLSELRPIRSQVMPMERISPANNNVSILIAEDNNDNFAIVARYLTNEGYRVERAVNGRDAVSAAARTRFGLILMDVEMPEMDGLQATALIRANEQLRSMQPVPIIALTAHAVMGYRERCLQAGCSGYLPKPLRKRAILSAVAAAVQNAPAPMQEESQLIYVEVESELADLVPAFLENCRRAVKGIPELMEESDWIAAARAGHSMKGTAPFYGFHEIGRLGRAIESACNSADRSALQIAIDALAQFLELVRVKNPAVRSATGAG